MKQKLIYRIPCLLQIILVILVSCRPKEQKNECIKGIIIGVNPCVEDANNSLNMRFLQILSKEVTIGSPLQLEDQIYQNVVQAYNVPPRTVIGDTLCFTYSTKVDPKVMPDCFPSILLVNIATIMIEIQSVHGCK